MPSEIDIFVRRLSVLSLFGLKIYERNGNSSSGGKRMTRIQRETEREMTELVEEEDEEGPAGVGSCMDSFLLVRNRCYYVISQLR